MLRICSTPGHEGAYDTGGYDYGGGHQANGRGTESTRQNCTNAPTQSVRYVPIILYA